MRVGLHPCLEQSGFLDCVDVLQHIAKTLRPGRRRGVGNGHQLVGVEPFGAWLTGRKRFQAATRAALPVFEAVGPRLRINPLARWTTADLADYMRRHSLRENPLVAYGYRSRATLSRSP